VKHGHDFHESLFLFVFTSYIYLSVPGIYISLTAMAGALKHSTKGQLHTYLTLFKLRGLGGMEFLLFK
jgi:hypothetical protein